MCEISDDLLLLNMPDKDKMYPEEHKRLYEWAEKFNNMEYGSNLIWDNKNKLEEEGIVVVVGASDDLCELSGAISDEYDCYSDTTLYWNGKDFISESRMEDFIDYVESEYPEFKNLVKNMFDKNCSFIKIKHPSGCQFEYETNIPCVKFKVIEDDNLYCVGFLFYAKNLNQKG